MTIHKTQGMIIDYLMIDLSNMFECDMIYETMNQEMICDHICVKGFKKECVKTDSRVLTFDKTI